MKKTARSAMIGIVTFFLMVVMFMCAGTLEVSHADEGTYNVGLFGANVLVHGGGYDQSYFSEEETCKMELVYYWTRRVNDLVQSDVTMDYDEFEGYVRDTFVNCDGLEEFLIENSGENDYFTYDKEDRRITLEPIYGGGGGGNNLVLLEDDTDQLSGSLYCAWEDPDDGHIVQRVVLMLEDGAIRSFMPEEKLYMVRIDPEVYDDMIRGLPGEKITVKASLVEYYRSDVENMEEVENARFRWSVGESVAEENAPYVDIEFIKEAMFPLNIEAFLSDGAEPVAETRIICGTSECKLGISAKDMKTYKAVSLSKLNAGHMYLFSLDDAKWGWDIGNDSVPYYEWLVKDPDGKTVTIKRGENEEGKSYISFDDNGTIYGNANPDRMLLFKTPGKYQITGRTYRKNVLFRKVTKTVNVSLKGTSISKLIPGKKRVTIKWKKQAEGTNGYQIMLALDKKFKKGKKTVNVSGTKAASKALGKLKAKKLYYARIRTVAKVSGKTYYSAWSGIKKVKTK